MNILYTCDDNYVWLMGISVISLFENNKKTEEINVYLLGENISIKNKDLLSNIEKNYKRKIIIIDVPKFDIPISLLTSRWPLSAFTRLFSAVLLPTDIENILYLDCDTIIRGSLDELLFSKNQNIISGVSDCVGKRYKENIGLMSDDIYINAGVLLLNLHELRKININVLIDDYLEVFEKVINYADQDILNGIFKNEIGVLKPSYNIKTIDTVYSYEEIITLRNPTKFYSKEEFENAVNNPHIIHYTTNMSTIRPWYSNSNHPYANDFRKYMSISPWKNKHLEKFTFKAREYRLIKAIQYLPSGIANKILGIIHSELRPQYIRMKSRRK